MYIWSITDRDGWLVDPAHAHPSLTPVFFTPPHPNPHHHLQNDEQVKRIVATRRRGARLKALHDLCKGSTKRMCMGSKPPEGVDPIMGAEMAGCGTMQVGGQIWQQAD
jgi:hypothetical protein